MKKFLEALRQKVLPVIRTIFGCSVAITLLGAGLTVLFYVVALIVGGDLAVKLCDIAYKQILLGVVVKATNITIVLGLIAMYINGEKALSPSEKKKKLTKKNDAEGTDD